VYWCATEKFLFIISFAAGALHPRGELEELVHADTRYFVSQRQQRQSTAISQEKWWPGVLWQQQQPLLHREQLCRSPVAGNVV